MHLLMLHKNWWWNNSALKLFSFWWQITLVSIKSLSIVSIKQKPLNLSIEPWVNSLTHLLSIVSSGLFGSHVRHKNWRRKKSELKNFSEDSNLAKFYNIFYQNQYFLCKNWIFRQIHYPPKPEKCPMKKPGVYYSA